MLRIHLLPFLLVGSLEGEAHNGLGLLCSVCRWACMPGARTLVGVHKL